MEIISAKHILAYYFYGKPVGSTLTIEDLRCLANKIEERSKHIFVDISKDSLISACEYPYFDWIEDGIVYRVEMTDAQFYCSFRSHVPKDLREKIEHVTSD